MKDKKACVGCIRCADRFQVVEPEINYTGDRPDIFVLGESPGAEEDLAGKPFKGRTGKYFRPVLDSITSNYILDNTVRCISDHKPTAGEMEACRLHWESVIKEHRPKFIVVLGNYAAEVILGKKVKISDYVGQCITINIDGESHSVIFSYHPSYVMRQGDEEESDYENVLEVWFDTWDLIQNMIQGGGYKAPPTRRLTHKKSIQGFLKWLKNDYDGLLSYDYETAGDYNALRPELCDDFRILSIGIGIGTPEPQGISLIFDTMDSWALPVIVDLWKKIISKSGHVAQNSKYEHKCNLKRFGLTTYLRDTMLAMNVIDELAVANLAALGRYCKIPWSGYKFEMGDAQKRPADVPLDRLLRYSALEGQLTYEVWLKLIAKIQKLRLENILQMKQKFAMHLAHIEMVGMHANPLTVEQTRDEIKEGLEKASEELHNHPLIKKTEKWAVENIKSFKKGSRFNPKSAPQVHHLCLDLLKLPVKPAKYKWKDGERVEGIVSLNKIVLEKFEDKHLVLKSLSRVRSLSAMLSGFLDKYEEFTGPDGHVHTNYTQEVVVTGRLSSIAPNLQNIPLESLIRKVFTSRYKNGWLIAADYSQLEPRLLAGWSGDRAMCSALNAGRDLHRFVASIIYGVDYDKVTEDQRHIAKRRNLGAMYGQTVEGLADATGLSFKEAKRIVEIYDKIFAGATQFRMERQREAIRYGQVKDLFGAIRHLRNAQSNDRIKRERALRQAGNYPIQSTGNYFHLIAMCVLRTFLLKREIEAVVIGVEHDKIYLDSTNHGLAPAIETTQEAMLIHNQQWYWKDKPVPVKVDIKYGRNLFKMEKWEESLFT